MSFDFNIILSKVAAFVRKFVLRSQVYDDPPMHIHFDKLRQPKRVYDLRKRYFTFSIKNKDDLYKYLFYALMLFLIFILPYSSVRTGISDNEWQTVQYVSSMECGEAAPADIPFLRSHSLLIDRTVQAVAAWFCPNDPFAARHVASAVFGWGAIFVTGLLLLKLLTWRAAFFGALLLFVSPRFTGNAYCNLNASAFAFAYIFSIYQIYLLFREMPKLKRKRLVLIVAGIILACTAHVGGAVLILYLIILAPLFYFINNPIRKFPTKEYLLNFGGTFIIGILIALCVYLICWIIYPGNSFLSVSPTLALSQMTAGTPTVQQLFEGQLVWSNHAPTHYLVKYLFITTPLVIFICFCLFFCVIKTAVRKTNLINMLTIALTFLYPVIYFTQHNLNVAEGISQFLFIYPVLVVMAVVGLESLLQKIDDRYTNVVIVSAAIFLTLLPLRNLILNHPHSIIYFNEISGGVHNAYGKYELDPQRQTNRKACTEFLKIVKEKTLRELCNDDKKITVCTNGNAACAHFFRNDTSYIDLCFCDYGQRYEHNWDYFISFPYTLSGYQLKNGLWISDEDRFSTISLERMPIVVIFKNNASDTTIAATTSLQE